MISYREKQLLMVMKMLQDDSINLSSELSKAVADTQQKKTLTHNITTLPEPVADYATLVDLAEEAGYDMYVRASDLLSQDELQDIERRKDEIEEQFKKITKLHGADYAFLFAAMAMQIARQALQPRLDFETLAETPENRKKANQTAAEADATKTKETVQKEKNKASKNSSVYDEKGKAHNPFYSAEEPWRASIKQIADIHKVPYDANGEGLDGNHRYKTLGHDPWLGYLFGTCNILTNTLTTNKMVTYHVRNGHTIAPGDIGNTGKMFQHSIDRFGEKDGKPAATIALVKQAYHIRTDVKSKKGIPLPFIQLFLDERTIEKLCNMGIDYNAVQFAGTIAKQALFAEMINFVVATTHRILVAKEEFDAYCKTNDVDVSNESTFVDALKEKGFHNIVFGNESLNEVRTRKILLVSNAVASTANIVYTGIAAGVSAYTGNTSGIYDALSKLDVGGILVTLRHLLSDGRVILKIKNDYIQQAINSDFEDRLKALD